MASSLNDPKLLYAIPGVSAFHLANGVEEALTPAGPQTLSLLMVPTASPFADASIEARPESLATPEDFYLHLHLPPALDLPLPATTQIYHQPPCSYLIPRWDLGRNSGVFTRLEFPAAGSRKGLQEDVDTFETILAQCTAFLERAPPPKSSRREKDVLAERDRVEAERDRVEAERDRETLPGESSSSTATSTSTPPQPYDQIKYPDGRYTAAQRSSSTTRSTRSSRTAVATVPAYNPASFKPGEAYAAGSTTGATAQGGQIVLVDEEDGSVIGELGGGVVVVEDTALQPGSKDPVEITLPTAANPSISVKPAAPTFTDDLHPAYQKSTLVANAAAASRLIVAGSAMVSRALQGQADKYAETATPATTPMTFQPSTHAHIRRINTLSAGAAGLSAKAVGQIGRVAQNMGAKLAGHKPVDAGGSGSGSSTPKSGKKGKAPTGIGPDGQPVDGFQPGLLNKSLMAFSTVADGIEQAGRHLLDTSSTAATTVVASKWGSEAGEVTRHLTGGIKNVGLVYIDVTGVSRRALIKSVAKGMVVGHVPGGGDLIVGETEQTEQTRPKKSASGTSTPPPLPARASSATDMGSVARSTGTGTGTGSTGSTTPLMRTRSNLDFADNNPYRGR